MRIFLQVLHFNERTSSYPRCSVFLECHSLNVCVRGMIIGSNKNCREDRRTFCFQYISALLKRFYRRRNALPTFRYLHALFRNADTLTSCHNGLQLLAINPVFSVSKHSVLQHLRSAVDEVIMGCLILCICFL